MKEETRVSLLEGLEVRELYILSLYETYPAVMSHMVSGGMVGVFINIRCCKRTQCVVPLLSLQAITASILTWVLFL